MPYSRGLRSTLKALRHVGKGFGERANKGLSGSPLSMRVCDGRSGSAQFTRISEDWSGTVFCFMFFDARSPLCLKDFRAFYVFCLVFKDF